MALVPSGTGVSAVGNGGRLGDRRGVRQGRGRHLAADGEPASRAERDGGARRRRALRAGQGDDDHLVVDAEPAHPALVHRRDDRPRPGSGARHRARSRRRLRRQDQHLRRGVRRGGDLEAARHPGEVDRGSLGSVRGHDARPRHPRLRGPRGEARRHGARPEAAAHRRHRRLQHAAHGRHPDADDDDGERHLQHPGDSHDAHRGLHQQDADRRVSRRRPSRGDLLRRARDGHARARAEDGSGRAPAQELHPAEPVSVRDADGRGLRLGRLREGARPRAEERRSGSS